MTASPAPAGNNTYVVGTTVTFCYTLTNYAQSGADWIAGFAITLGPGWDPTSLTPLTPPNSCDGQGTWDWYTSCTGTASGTTWGPGFYYDTPAGSPAFVADGIPGNNFGDNCQNSSWDFCFTVTVGPCASASNAPLNVGIQALSDYQAGSWGNNACFDPPFTAPAQWPNGVPSAQCNCVLIVPNITITDVSCAGQNNGAVTVFPQGVAPYSYQWSNGATSQTISNLAPGIYTCTVTDSTQCTKTVTVPVSGAQPIVLNETVSGNVCDNASGSISLAPTGGTGQNFTYLWSNGATSSNVSGLSGGTYTVTVTDANGCTQTGSFNINSVIPVTVSSGGNQSTCSGDPVTIAGVASGGTLPYSYTWSNGAVSGAQSVNPSSTTVYTLTVTDANGCSSQASVTVDVTPYPSLLVSQDLDICYEASTQISASGATTYSWSPSAGLSDPNIANPTANPLTTTTFVVTAANGSCTATDSVTITVLPQIIPSFVPDTVQGFTPFTVNFNNTSSGANTYNWAFGDGNTSTDQNPTHVYETMGEYTVLLTVTNALGCSDTVSFSYIIVDSFSSLFIPNIFTPNGDNLNDTFHFDELAIIEISCNIFNRWGKEVYSWNELESGWDGKSSDGTELPEGSYIYVVKATGIEGKTYDLSGFFQLVRGK
ncbi:MAG: gliding motility-associated C-terminal domain-containing protein [Bacteroidota bacterium]